MSFKIWSLDFIYYPVSGIMWVWHKVFGFLFGGDYANPWVWVLSVVFLVFSLRALLFKPFMKQMDAQLKMQAIQPEMKRLREKYKDDRQRLTEEMMKLNKEAGVNPLASCLPMLLQAPAFIGLFNVLRHFINAYGTGGDTVTNNYFFPPADVVSFHNALLFDGASLSAHLTMSGSQLLQLGANRETMLWVAIPLMILAAVATHMTSRKSVSRQAQMGTVQTGGQMALMQKLMLWVFPLAVIVIGWFYPLALLFYWLANNSWTLAQLWVAHRVQDRKIAAESKVVEEEKQNVTFSKPQPGAKPQRAKGSGAQAKSSSGGSQNGAPSRGAVKPSPVNRAQASGDLPPGMVADSSKPARKAGKKKNGR